MSGEFGWCWTGYIHRQIAEAASCCEREGGYELTALWGRLFAAMTEPVRGMCYAEASDTSEEDAANALLDGLEPVCDAIAALESYCRQITGRTEGRKTDAAEVLG